MKLTYLAHARLPTEKAHGAQIMKTCEALVRGGATVILVVPKRRNSISEDPFTYYGVTTRFDIRFIDAPFISLGKFGFLLSTLWFSLAALVHLEKDAGVFCRDEVALAVVGLLTRRDCYWETHTGSWNLVARYVARRAKRVFVLTEGAKVWYRKHGVPEQKLVVVPDSVDVAAFREGVTQETARQGLGLPLEKKIVLYVGRLDGWKGTKTLFKAADFLPEDVLVAVIGGEEAQVQSLSRTYPKIRFLGPRPYRQLPQHIRAADVVVLPNTGKDPVSERFTSPLKLFAYMASGIPMVLSDLPSLREVVSDNAAYFVEADNPEELAKGIVSALAPEARTRAERAREAAKSYTWDARAVRILAAL
jgi:glycosyltransferase involved in cell wall biosynthesis